ncbi:MAG: hypothetical protein ABI680_17370 [Chthoniobacteraceae bacterium]
MKTPALTAAVAVLLSAFALAATPEQEKAFTDTIKKEIESKDEKAFFAHFMNVGIMPVPIQEMVKASITEKMGSTVDAIEMTPITKLPPDQQKAAEEKLAQAKVPAPTRLMKVSFKSSDGNSSSMKFPITEKDGKLMILW